MRGKMQVFNAPLVLSSLRGGRCFCFLPLSDLPVTANVSVARGTAAPPAAPSGGEHSVTG